jgi:hypothetical protein
VILWKSRSIPAPDSGCRLEGLGVLIERSFPKEMSVFFMPPRRHGIASISVNNQRLEPHVSGRQLYDPSLLSQLAGHGDVLRPKDGKNAKPDAPTSPEARIAQPAEISLQAVVIVELDPEASAGTCNLLFSQGLHDKLISAEVQKHQQRLAGASNIFVRGELPSVALDPDGCTAVRIQLQKHPSFSNRTSDTARPPFGLIDVWTAAGKTRLP